jgi:signal recognition particle GTPase
MTNYFNKHLVKAVADLAIILEFTEKEFLDADIAIQVMEQLASELQQMNEVDRSNLARQLRELSFEYSDKDKALFIENMPESFGLA